MGIFNIFNTKKTNSNNQNQGYKPVDYYEAQPDFYSKEDIILGACALTEGVLTVLHKSFDYTVQGKKVDNYRLFLYDSNHDKIGEVDYYKALELLKDKDLTMNNNYILVNLNIEQLKEIAEKLK